jgi:RNA polymerase sigma factor (sigma-70 family)
MEEDRAIKNSERCSRIIKIQGAGMEKSEIETIYRKYFHDVFLYIRALSENESLAEEITQETFLKAMNNIEKFDGRKDIRAWLFVIAKNTYFRYCRRNKIYVGEEFSEIMQDSIHPRQYWIRSCRMRQFGISNAMQN